MSSLIFMRVLPDEEHRLALLGGALRRQADPVLVHQRLEDLLHEEAVGAAQRLRDVASVDPRQAHSAEHRRLRRGTRLRAVGLSPTCAQSFDRSSRSPTGEPGRSQVRAGRSRVWPAHDGITPGAGRDGQCSMAVEVQDCHETAAVLRAHTDASPCRAEKSWGESNGMTGSTAPPMLIGRRALGVGGFAFS